jgi:lipopolysaccharide transport system permease protein
MTTHSDDAGATAVETDADADTARQEHFGHRHVTEISQSGRSLASDLREIWLYRDLLALLIRRDISVRYKQSTIGIAWAVVQPLVLMTIFSIVFGRFAKLPSEGYPYPLFILCALLPWLYFSRSLTGASDSMVASASLVTKVYFPRLILPISKTVSGLVDFAIALVLLAGALAWYRVMPGWELLLLPVFIGIAMLSAFAIGLWLTALNVRYRDIGLIVPFIVQIWMYASPIAYSTTLVPAHWRWIYSLNPMVGVAEGFRWALLGKAPPDSGPMFLSLLIVVLMLFAGLVFFRHTERSFADII